jgi:hypothetical protein
MQCPTPPLPLWGGKPSPKSSAAVHLPKTTNRCDLVKSCNGARHAQAAMEGGGSSGAAPVGSASEAAAVVAEMAAKLEPLLSSFESQLSKVEADKGTVLHAPQLASWLRASAFEALNLQSQLADVATQLGVVQAATESDPAAPPPPPLLVADSPAERAMIRIISELAPGSDLHVLLAAKALSRAQQHVLGAGSSSSGDDVQGLVRGTMLPAEAAAHAEVGPRWRMSN